MMRGFHGFSHEKQQPLKEEEIRAKHRINNEQHRLDSRLDRNDAVEVLLNADCTAADAASCEAPTSTTDSEKMFRTGKIISALQVKQIAAWHQVCAIKNHKHIDTDKLEYESSDQSTDVPSDSEEDDAEWSDFMDGGSWGDVEQVSQEVPVFEDGEDEEGELESNNCLVPIDNTTSISNNQSIFSPRKNWDPRQGGTLRRLELQQQYSDKHIEDATRQIEGSARCRKEAVVEARLCGSALKAVKLLRKRGEGKLDALVDSWDNAKLDSTLKYDSREQGVSVVPEGGFDWSKMSVHQRSLVAENIKQYKLAEIRRKNKADQDAECTFAPKTKHMLNKDGRQIESRVAQQIRRPSRSTSNSASQTKKSKSSKTTRSR